MFIAIATSSSHTSWVSCSKSSRFDWLSHIWHGLTLPRFWACRVLVLAAALCGVCPVYAQPHAPPPAKEAPVYDIVIYGGTSAAVTAAVQARRMNKSVIILEPGQHIGGLTTGGLGATDIGNKGAIGGLARAFYQQVHQHYASPTAWRQQDRQQYLEKTYVHVGVRKPDPIAARTGVPAMWTFEPHVAQAIFARMLKEANVPVHLGQRLAPKAGVRKRAGRIVALRMINGRLYEGRMFIDTTYEGDLMAAAGVPFTVGREANTRYKETLNGVQTARATQHNFKTPVDPFVIPGDPKSGLLPGIEARPPGPDGSGDHRVQAYNFRMTMTDAPDNRVPITAPPNYDPLRYELLRRYIDSGVFDAIKLNTAMPNRKTDINNHGAFSSDHIGANYKWPNARAAVREALFEDHKNYIMGLWYFLQNDPRLPASVREDASRWGLCKDEFVDTGHWPHALYVREGRRMISDYVMTEHDCRGTRVAPDSVGLGAYGMDSHNVQRYVAQGRVLNEGDVQVGVEAPYPISYRSILAPARYARNLLVPVALSATHIAFGSIRMEPVFMVLGQSAATAAALALTENTSLHRLPYERLRSQLLQDNQVLRAEVP